jgi:hypothetical protein
VDFNGLLLLGFLWILVNLLSRARGDARPRPRQLPEPRPARPPTPTSPHPAAGDPTQREGSQLERLLRELERNLEQVGEPQRRPAPPPLPEAEDVEERTSLEEEENVVSLETEVTRQPRPRYDHDDAAEEVAKRRIAAAEARSGELTKAEHIRFDERIRQQPADHTAVRRYTPAQLRDAIVWREILGPPVSEREP